MGRERGEQRKAGVEGELRGVTGDEGCVWPLAMVGGKRWQETAVEGETGRLGIKEEGVAEAGGRGIEVGVRGGVLRVPQSSRRIPPEIVIFLGTSPCTTGPVVTTGATNN